MDSEAITVSRTGSVARVTLNRPSAKNALTVAMAHELSEVLSVAATDQSVAALVLAATGDVFCAGADLGRFEEHADARSFRFESHVLTEIVSLIERIEKPVIGRINGLAVGFGVQLALACDLRVGSDSAAFAFTEGRVGLLPTHGGVARLVKLVGMAEARNLLLASEVVEAERAHALGLLTSLVPNDDLDTAVDEMTERALSRAPQSYGLVKRLLLLAANADMQSAMVAETIGQSLLIDTEDHAEGLRAFRERRQPRFTGK